MHSTLNNNNNDDSTIALTQEQELNQTEHINIDENQIKSPDGQSTVKIESQTEGNISPLKRKLLIDASSNDEANQMVQEQILTALEEQDLDENARLLLKLNTAEQLKKKICILKLKQLNEIRHECIDNLSEQLYLEKNLNYLEYDKWKKCEPKIINEFVNKKFANKDDIFTLEKNIGTKLKFSLPLIEQPVNSSTSSSLGSSLLPSKQANQSIAERAKHEAQILQRISQLRKEGLWSIKRLPKLVEPARPKTHWDFLLDEMTWMSTDFQQERKWKKNCSKKLALAIQKYFKEKELKADLMEREETKRLRKQANMVARDIMQFWRNVERIIEYKQRTLMEEKRKHALDVHLNFIVDQTEKYSSWLMEGLNNSTNNNNLLAIGSTSSEQNNETSKSSASLILILRE